jgi:hypothetical protein
VVAAKRTQRTLHVVGPNYLEMEFIDETPLKGAVYTVGRRYDRPDRLAFPWTGGISRQLWHILAA